MAIPVQVDVASVWLCRKARKCNAMLTNVGNKLRLLKRRDLHARVPVRAPAALADHEYRPARDDLALALVLRVGHVLPGQCVAQRLEPLPRDNAIDGRGAIRSERPVVRVIQHRLPCDARLCAAVCHRGQRQLCERWLWLQPRALPQVLDAGHHGAGPGPRQAEAAQPALGHAHEQRAAVHRRLRAELPRAAARQPALLAEPREDLRLPPLNSIPAHGVLLVAPRAAEVEVSAPLALAGHTAEAADLFLL
mmetsp:Transcript_89187/g.247678  ORF Transcript_89187/g.247678 Transcript_89187/m.247678 type:complete len:250 (+) Transcript_89187:426-1175(+)